MPPQPSARFQGLLPEGVAVFDLAGAGDPALLLPGEREQVCRASLLRTAQFAAGRQCARHAAACHGVVDVPIGTRPDGRPLWPARLTGSITHTAGFAAAAVGERHRFRAVGIDAERVEAVSPEVWNHILSPPEARAFHSLPVPARTAVAALIYSAKESYYKCQFELSRQWLEFRDMAVSWAGDLVQPSTGVCEVRVAGRLEGRAAPAQVRYRFTEALVLTATVLPAR